MTTQPKNRRFSLFRLRMGPHAPSLRAPWLRGVLLRALLAGGLLLAWCTLGAVPSAASSIEGTVPTGQNLQDPGDPPTLIKHLRTELSSKDPMRRDKALVDIITLGRCTASCSVFLVSISGKKVSFGNETGTGRAIDLEVLTPDLIRVYQKGPADGHRLMALSALINIGSQAALKKLAREIASQSAGVQRHTHRTMVAYYLEKYPELREETVRTRVLKIEDVDRAERVRLRLAEKATSGPQN